MYLGGFLRWCCLIDFGQIIAIALGVEILIQDTVTKEWDLLTQIEVFLFLNAISNPEDLGI